MRQEQKIMNLKISDNSQMFWKLHKEACILENWCARMNAVVLGKRVHPKPRKEDIESYLRKRINYDGGKKDEN